jgi:hypothetical protein
MKFKRRTISKRQREVAAQGEHNRQTAKRAESLTMNACPAPGCTATFKNDREAKEHWEREHAKSYQ